jgi:flagellar biosynthesis chaperone FliJ
MLRFDPDDVEPSDIAREITELRAKLAEAERNVNRLTLYAKEEVERLRNDRDELVRLFGELWGECCPDCGPRDFKGIVELVSKERDQLRTKLTEAERQQREFADGQFTMLADHYGAPVQWEHHPGQVVTLNPMGRINRLVADLRGECDQLRQRAEGLERNKESEDKEWMASIGNMARLAQSHLNEIDRLAAELTEIKAETVEYVLDGGDFNWTAAVIAIRDWRERAGVCDKLQSELAAARRREEGMRRACEPLRRFAAAYAQSAWTDSDRIGVPHVASFTVGEARAFLAALSPEPAPPSEVPAGEREFVCPGCGGPICTNPDANGNLCCRRRVAHDREGCGWHGTWAEVAAAKAADNTKGAAN